MNETLLQQKSIRLLVMLVLIGVAVALGAYTNLTLKQAAGTHTSQATISVSGKGEVLAKPNIGTFSFAVTAEGADAVTAQNDATKAMDAVVAYLKDNKVDEKDIKTTSYNLSPKYVYEAQPCPAGASYCPPGQRKQDGFTVTQNVTVKVRDLNMAGTLLSGVGDKGATNISSLSFTIDDDTALQSQARDKAIADAKTKAEALAASLGMHLGKIVGFNDNGTPYPIAYGMGGDTLKTMSATAEAAPAVVPTGENTITSNVTLTYELY